jgi:hypothetical protein
MFSQLRNRFGVPGVIAVIALVFAMFGGAYAASGGLTPKQKKEVKKIAKQEARKLVKAGPAGPAGPVGPAGPAGPAGAAGAQGAIGPEGPTGPTGADGADGTNGTNGNTILSGTTAPSAGLGNDGDFYLRTTTSEIVGPKTAGVWGSGTSLKGADGAAGEPGEPGEPGPPGSPWVVGTAPSNVILKGTWAIQQYTAAGAGETIHVPISTGVPVPTGPTLRVAVGAGLVNTEEDQQVAEALCPGTAANPTISTGLAEEFGQGVICIYAQEQTNLTPPEGASESTNFPLGSSGGGAVANFESTGAGVANGFGSWAMFTP